MTGWPWRPSQKGGDARAWSDRQPLPKGVSASASRTALRVPTADREDFIARPADASLAESNIGRRGGGAPWGERPGLVVSVRRSARSHLAAGTQAASENGNTATCPILP